MQKVWTWDEEVHVARERDARSCLFFILFSCLCSQDATNIKFHDGVGVPINVLRGTNDRRDVWLGFSDGNIAIMSVENKSIGTRWKGHPGGVSCIVAMTHSVWSGDFYVLCFNTRVLCSIEKKSYLRLCIDVVPSLDTCLSLHDFGYHISIIRTKNLHSNQVVVEIGAS